MSDQGISPGARKVGDAAGEQRRGTGDAAVAPHAASAALADEPIDRATGIGGSELADVMNEKPYGCARRLVYKKRRVPPDYPEQNVLVLQRGQELEELVAQRWLREKGDGRKLVRRKPVRHATLPLIASVDREILGDPRGVGVLECKSHNVHVFRGMVRDGLPAGHILQMAAYLYVRGRAWGAYAVLCPDTWQLLAFEVERDDRLIEAVLPHVERVWRAVEHGPLPDQLDPKDPRCARCPWRRTCWGEGLVARIPERESDAEIPEDDSFAELLGDLADARQLREESEAVENAIKDRIREKLGDRQAVRTPGFRVYYRPSVSTRIDTAGLRAKYPAIAKEVEKPVTTRALRVYAV